MTHMGRENIMGNARSRHIFDPRRLFDAEARRLPCDPRPFKGHVGIACGVKRDGVRAVGGILGSLEPVTILYISPHHPTPVVSHQELSLIHISEPTRLLSISY